MLPVAGVEQGGGVSGGVAADSTDERPGAEVERPPPEGSLCCLGDAESDGVGCAYECCGWSAEVPLCLA